MFNNLAKKAAVGAAGLAVASVADSAEDRPKGTNPTAKRIGIVVGAVVAWEFIEAALERKLNITDKKK